MQMTLLLVFVNLPGWNSVKGADGSGIFEDFQKNSNSYLQKMTNGKRIQNCYIVELGFYHLGCCLCCSPRLEYRNVQLSKFNQWNINLNLLIIPWSQKVVWKQRKSRLPIWKKKNFKFVNIRLAKHSYHEKIIIIT